MNETKTIRKPSVISLFAGGGGSSLGYKWAGFNELLAIDYNKNCCEVLEANFPGMPVWNRDITKVTSQEILDFTGLQVGELDLLDGSPPCQGFSSANTRAKPEDERNMLVFHQIRLIEEIRPKVFVIENVEGMVKGKNKKLFQQIASELNSLDYKVKCRVLNAKHYGVPQSRKRTIIIGVRNDLRKDPVYPDHIPGPVISFTDATGYDGFRSDQFDCNKFPGSRPICTITRTPNIMFINGDKEFKPEIYNIKVLSSFPRDYILIGSYSSQWAVLGNAVPPLMVKAIGKTIYDEILFPLENEQEAGWEEVPEDLSDEIELKQYCIHHEKDTDLIGA